MGTAHETVAVVRRKFEQVIPGWNVALIDELMSEDIVSNDPSEPEPLRGRDAYRAAMEEFGAAFPALHIRMDRQIAEGDTVVTSWTASGRHDGELYGVPPTGKEVTFTGIDIHRVAGGRIVEEWSQWDALGLLRQLGLVQDL